MAARPSASGAVDTDGHRSRSIASDSESLDFENNFGESPVVPEHVDDDMRTFGDNLGFGRWQRRLEHSVLPTPH